MKTYGKDPKSHQIAFEKLMSTEPAVTQTADVKGFKNDFYALAKMVKEMEGCMEENFKLEPHMIELMREAIGKVSMIKYYVEANEIETEEDGEED